VEKEFRSFFLCAQHNFLTLRGKNYSLLDGSSTASLVRPSICISSMLSSSDVFFFPQLLDTTVEKKNDPSVDKNICFFTLSENVFGHDLDYPLKVLFFESDL
jgi:hypothetical protein